MTNAQAINLLIEYIIQTIRGDLDRFAINCPSDVPFATQLILRRLANALSDNEDIYSEYVFTRIWEE